ncbi:MAG: bile acid:sodium symporter [Spongiibacteraceae bacterium]|mgnify:FL=1|nr:bile acid:sodium symporter [Spongiibacteraceae bacterium]
MAAGSITTVFFPMALAIIMLGLGLSLTLSDFRRVMQAPRTVLIALACQVVLLPVVCFGTVYAFALPPELAVGLMLLAASPGGTSANLYSHLADGDVALNISLTAVNSVLSIVTLPLVVNFSLAHFMNDGATLPLQLSKVLQVFAVVLIPVVVGMVIRRQASAFSDAMAPFVKKASAIFLFLVIAAAVASDWQNILAYAALIGVAALFFNLASLGVGYAVPRMLNVGRRQATAIGMEIGIHNSVLAITVAMSPALLNNPTMAIPAAIYGLIANLTAAGFGWWVSRPTRPNPGYAD